ncbi:hypothetical protein DFQ26_005645 [Actinomortierella ambigua]|nr:hypothetical protein DFQ26_005645 [Actinomortierella ambigua]
MGIPLVDVQRFSLDPLLTTCNRASASSDEQEQDNDVLGALAAPSSDDISKAALALSRSMTANATRYRQDLEDGRQARFFVPPLPPPPPPPPVASSWFTMLIYNFTHSHIYRLITEPSTVIVDLTSRHFHSLQEYSERQSPLGGVLSIFSSSASKGHEPLRKRRSMYHLTEEEDRLARNPEQELAKAVELLPVSMDAVRPAKTMLADDDSDDEEMDSVTSGSEYSDDDDYKEDDDTAPRTAFAGRPTQGRRRRRRRRMMGGQGHGQGAVAYRNPFVGHSRTTTTTTARTTRGNVDRHLHYPHRNHSAATAAYLSSEGEESEEAFDDALEWDGDDIASGYEARTNSVRLTEKGFQNQQQNCVDMMDHDDNNRSLSPPDSNSYSLHLQKSSNTPRPNSSLHLFDDGPILARLPKSKVFPPPPPPAVEQQQQERSLQHRHGEDEHGPPVVHDHPPPTDQSRGVASFARSRWQQQQQPSSGSVWATASHAAPIPSEEDVRAAVHDQPPSSSSAFEADDYLRTTPAATRRGSATATTTVKPHHRLSNGRRSESSSTPQYRYQHRYPPSPHPDPYPTNNDNTWHDDGNPHPAMDQDSEGYHDESQAVRQSSSIIAHNNNVHPSSSSSTIGTTVTTSTIGTTTSVSTSSSSISNHHHHHLPLHRTDDTCETMGGGDVDSSAWSQQPSPQRSTWMRLDATNDLDASPPTSSAMTSRSLEDEDVEEEDDDDHEDDNDNDK